MKSLDLYLRLPHPLRQLAVVGLSAVHKATRYGPTYDGYLEMLTRSERWPADRQARLQSEQLRRLLDEAIRGTEHYGETLGHLLSDELDRIAEELDMASLPRLEKATLKANTPRFFNRLRKTVARSSTSGSTGAPLVVEYDAESLQQRAAIMQRHRMWLGLAPNARCLRVSGRQIVPSTRMRAPFWIDNPLERQLLVSSYHLRADHLPSIVARIQRFEPELVEGYPTAIYQIARFCEERGLGVPSLRLAITTAETLDPEMRAQIERGLGLKVLDYYAASEGVPFIQQCEAGRYHMRPETGVFEILDPEGAPVGPGETGELVVTAFAQWKTPLIRYRTGDLARRFEGGEPECPCGRTLPAVAGIVGRLEDLVKTPDGRTIGMFSYRTLKHVPGITEAQILQQSPERFRLRIVYDETRPRERVEREIVDVFESVLGYRPQVHFEALDIVPRGPNGKFRSVVREF